MVKSSILYPLRIRGGKPTKLLVVIMAIFFCTVNGYMQSRALLVSHPLPADHLTSPSFIFGAFLFFAGFLINYHSDHLLRNLRKPGETGYKIPRGGAFDLLGVSVANYTGEIIEWTGFAIACGSFESFAFIFGTMANLVPRALDYHKSYQQRFGKDYPKERKVRWSSFCS
jgi:3-oxo-5-alpha-steroid 4-dehydrogenase 1